MGNKWIIVIVAIVIVLFISLMVFFAITSMRETREVCESEGGEYEHSQNRCFLKKDGMYEKYYVIKINGIKRLVRG